MMGAANGHQSFGQVGDTVILKQGSTDESTHTETDKDPGVVWILPNFILPHKFSDLSGEFVEAEAAVRRAHAGRVGIPSFCTEGAGNAGEDMPSIKNAVDEEDISVA